MLLAVLLFISAVGEAKEVVIKNEKCLHCHFIAETFFAGLLKTANKHFAGGDTAWEEKNLGKYKTSETRLIEVMEGVCKKSSLQNTDKYSKLSELEFKCSALFEEHEELVEEWYKKQDSDLLAHLCIEKLALCCPDDKFGKNCDVCPGVAQGAAVCFGHGKCHGAGSREGSGKCKCEEAYTGHACQHCASNHWAVAKTATEIICEKCHDSCASGCTGPTQRECVACATGWRREEGEGCVDIDECKAEGSNERCTGAYEVCVNTPGSHRCDCEEGYVRGKESNVCELDVVADAYRPLLPPALLLRAVAYAGLVGGILVTVTVHPSKICIGFAAAATLAAALIEMYGNPDMIPDAAKQFLKV